MTDEPVSVRRLQTVADFAAFDGAIGYPMALGDEADTVVFVLESGQMILLDEPLPPQLHSITVEPGAVSVYPMAPVDDSSCLKILQWIARLHEPENLALMRESAVRARAFRDLPRQVNPNEPPEGTC